MNALPYRLDRAVVIEAAPDTVFTFFTDSERWARWWGAGSTIDARPGGQLLIRHPNGVEISGKVLELAPPARIVFTYGFASGTPIAPGGSQVTIFLEPHPDGTRLRLTHEFADATVRDHHVQGWRYQLSVFGNVVADLVHADAAGLADAWFGIWTETDAGARAATLSGIATADVRFRDRYGLVDGADDLLPHIEAAQRFMPGIRLQRAGDVRHCQGTVLADWVALGTDGKERSRGTNVFRLAADGRIRSVTGLWDPPRA